MSDEFNIDQVISVDFEADSELNVQVGSSFQGASIDDTVVSTKKTWSSQKISNELNTKADDSATTAALALKANSEDVYTKTQTYTKTEVDTALEDKPDAWEGTQAEYDALSVKDPDTIYFIIDANGSGQSFQPVIYSTEEREIGVWVDGRPVYEKTLNVGAIGSGTTFAHGITNLDWIIDYSLLGLYGGETKLVSPANGSNGSIGFVIAKWDSTNITFTKGNLSSNFSNCYCTIRYTKSTDQAGSGQWTPQGIPTVHYSTDEQVIGTWIDGKALYQKTLVFQAPSTRDYTHQSLGVSVDYATIVDSAVIKGGQIGILTGDYDGSPANDEWQGFINKANSSFDYRVGATYLDGSCYLTIRYTKTST